MRVFTVTFLNHNYGSMLQAYALQRALKENGVQPVIIQKKPAAPSASSKIRKLYRTVKPSANYSSYRKIKLMLQEKKFSEKYSKLKDFIKKYLSVIYVNNAEEIIPDFHTDDVLLAGSDQIWSMAFGPVSKWYTFDWKGLPDSFKKYSFAASVGSTDFSEAQKSQYSAALRSFDVVSFREQQAADELEPYLSSKVRCDIDPTLLYGQNVWSEMASDRLVNEPYVFIYMLRPDKRLIQMGKNYAKEHHCKVIYTGLMANNFQGVETVLSAGVEDFLSYIKNAEAVITNSFHGTVFSVLFQKQFVTVRIASTSSRAENLLNKLGLFERQIEDESGMSVMDRSIDFDSAFCRLEAERKKSLEYIRLICSGSVTAEKRQNSYFESLLSKDCRGCGACAENCPVGAIRMQSEDGFYYPHIDEEKCIRCQLCVKTCVKASNISTDINTRQVYYGWNTDPQKRWSSTSGGAFPAIVDAFLSVHSDAWIYGAVYNSDFYVVHTGTRDQKTIAEMCRSKYVQSDIRGIYSQVIEHLDRKEYVLFSGTPCQIAGLKAVVGDHPYLLTVDFVCHGVSNPAYFHRYIKELEERYHAEITSYSFRNKVDTPNKKSYRLVKYQFENGEEQLTDQDLFVISYKYRMFYRDSCYYCPFASLERYSDITMGDFWGLENMLPALKAERLKGISMVMFNTKASLQLKEAVSDYFELNLFDGSMDDYKHLFLPSAMTNKNLPAYRMQDSFIDYLNRNLSKKERYQYSHRTQKGTLRRTKSIIRRLLAKSK